MTRFYEVADFGFSVTLEAGCDAGQMLPSFAPFEVGEAAAEKKVFEFAECALPSVAESAEFLEEELNDMGLTRLFRVPGGYRVELRYAADGDPHVMETTPDFSSVRASVRWDDRYAGLALSSMLRIVFAQAVLPYGAVSLHASVVVYDGLAFLFMGKSGTGKSTHSALWLKHVPGSWLLNDDNPVVRMTGGRVVAYGSPWSGKTPCYVNRSAPVAGMVRLRQASHNRFLPREDVAAFATLLPACSVLRQDGMLYDALCDVLVRMAEDVTVGELECLPDSDAVRLCKESVLKRIK